MKDILNKLCGKVNLSREEAKTAMSAIMDGEATPVQVAAFLVAMKMKGETAEEICGCATAMRERAATVRTARTELTDTCGTGGDGKGTFNISTVAALVAAGAGLPVAKHGNRSVSGLCGSADVLEVLGVTMELTPEEMGECLDKVGIAFLYAPVLHRAMRHAAGPRREVGVRSVFNLLGPLTNPAGARRQLMGVYAPELVKMMADVLLLLGAEQALAVHGSDGSDELALSGESLLCEVSGGRVTCRTFAPEEAGLARAPSAALQGGGPAQNARLATAVLQGRQGPRRDVSLLNAGAALYVGGRAEDLREGVQLAARAIDSGAAMAKLEALKTFTERCKKNAGANCG
jgi:anthranilate phosphoribosyltransferase